MTTALSTADKSIRIEVDDSGRLSDIHLCGQHSPQRLSQTVISLHKKALADLITMPTLDHHPDPTAIFPQTAGAECSELFSSLTQCLKALESATQSIYTGSVSSTSGMATVTISSVGQVTDIRFHPDCYRESPDRWIGDLLSAYRDALGRLETFTESVTTDLVSAIEENCPIRAVTPPHWTAP